MRLRLRLRARSEGEGGGRVWSVEGEGSVGGGGEGGPHRMWCGVVWYHRLIESGGCRAGDAVVLPVALKRRALKRRTTQGEGA